ncbi:TauD/TfdA family dioxygenase [Pigmentiphaga soli]|uniref:TauD/TfdA family dioxygenase n=1 Tax=Pigmentiphaga soli TaxID=1007095 RepID=A0ABP8GLI1_9BURK
MQNGSNIVVEPVTGAIGAEIVGVDISRPLDDATVAALRQALLDHCVIFFRDQELDMAGLKAFAARFGEIFLHPNILGSKADPAVIEIIRQPGEKRIVGEDWHSDTAHVAAPPMGSVLYGVDVPPYGGDTLFANQYLAYETLSPGLKRMLEGVRALHSDRDVAGPAAELNANRSTKVRENPDWRETAHFHPVVRTHPETGRKALYVNRQTTMAFEHMTPEESRPLLEYLCRHAHRPEFSCRFRWRRGSVAFWDNRCAQHTAVHDAGRFRREMRRVQLVGDAPF